MSRSFMTIAIMNVISQSGSYLLDLIDGAVLGYPVLMVGLMECIVVVILYGQ